MAEFMSEKLYKEFLEIVKRGDEQEARSFLVEHLKEFPQETQDSIVMAFFEEALTKSKADADLISKFQKEGLEVIDILEKRKAQLEDKAKLIAVKKSL